MLGTIFRKAQNKIQDPAKLRRLIVDLIDKNNRDLLRSGSQSERPVLRPQTGSGNAMDKAALDL